MIERKVSGTILENLKLFPVVGIIGPRQVGKTTLVKSLIPQINKEVIYLDIELPSDFQKLANPEIFLNRHMDKCVIIDEIQRKPELFGILRALIDQKRNPARFIILGSASPVLLKKNSESLAGRIAYTELSPFLFTEISSKVPLIHHWYYGGFPDGLLSKTNSSKKVWIDNFIKTYTEKDLPLLGIPISPQHIRRLWTMLAHLSGQILNMTQLSKSLGVSSPSIKTYIDFFEQAFIVKRLESFSYNIGKRIVKSPKIYLTDTGILHRLIGFDDFESLNSHPIFGFSWENYVFNQIRYSVREGLDIYYYRTQNGSEIDLVFTQGLKPIATAEIKYTSTPSLTRGNTEAIHTLKTKKNYIITPDSDTYPINEITEVCSLQTFTEKILPHL